MLVFLLHTPVFVTKELISIINLFLLLFKFFSVVWYGIVWLHMKQFIPKVTENISKPKLESEVLTHSLMCVSETTGLHFTVKRREREREKKKTKHNQGHKHKVFNLSKRGNIFRLNPNQQQVLNTFTCPMAAIKH